VANDTLVMHLAEARQVPTSGIFGPTDPEHTGPPGPMSRAVRAGEALPCSPCHDDGYFPVCSAAHQCKRDIPVDRLAALVSEIVGVAAPAGVTHPSAAD